MRGARVRTSGPCGTSSTITEPMGSPPRLRFGFAALMRQLAIRVSRSRRPCGACGKAEFVRATCGVVRARRDVSESETSCAIRRHSDLRAPVWTPLPRSGRKQGLACLARALMMTPHCPSPQRIPPWLTYRAPHNAPVVISGSRFREKVHFGGNLQSFYHAFPLLTYRYTQRINLELSES